MPTSLRPRPACRADAAALEALSRPFVRSGALRPRPGAVYAAHAADFLVADSPSPDGGIEGCLALAVHPPDPARGRGPAGVLYNFCVAPHRQGRGLGALLLEAALDRAAEAPLGTLFTATTGSGALFLRYGFTPVSPGSAPAAWARAVDPRRGARVLGRTV
ncbi:GNAT family N-acetyltransferase [Streptomyces chumphonensis]|uniref:GNAT family N-acetyltransferase n=1 Tax=Streptomyces chumphonensis TaxID=1214925 RepID=UPI003D71D0DF